MLKYEKVFQHIIPKHLPKLVQTLFNNHKDQNQNKTNQPTNQQKPVWYWHKDRGIYQLDKTEKAQK